MTEVPTSNAAPISANLASVHARIARACDRSGRNPADVTLVAISKTHAPEAVQGAFNAGQRVFGENRVQEAATKISVLDALGIKPQWHLVGHLQRNKAATAASLFHTVHSIDSLQLAQAIDDRASQHVVRGFIEVNVSGEATKNGVELDAAAALAESIGQLKRIELVGLMTVAPLAPDPEQIRPVFRQLRELRDAIGLAELSMGMTGDFEIAIEEGATFVRVGRAIFGERSVRV